MADFRPPAPKEDTGDQGSYAPWLQPKDLPGYVKGKGSKQAKLKILGVRETPDAEFSAFALDVTINGKKKSFGVRENSPNHRFLNEMKWPWKGKILIVESRWSKRYKKDFVSIVNE